MERPFLIQKYKLNHSDIYRWRTFLTLLYVKSNPVAFIEGLETGCIDTWMMNKYIRAIFLLNEAITFAAIKPLTIPLAIVTHSFQKNFHGSKLQVAALTNGSGLQSETGPPIKNGPLLINRQLYYYF